MARRSILASAVERQTEEAHEATTPALLSTPRRRSTNAGKYHLGGYFAPDDPDAEAFRMLAAKTRRSHQELLGEAIADLVAKYETAAKFAR